MTIQYFCGGLILFAILLAALWVFLPGGRRAALKDYEQLKGELNDSPNSREELAARHRILPPGSEMSER